MTALIMMLLIPLSTSVLFLFVGKRSFCGWVGQASSTITFMATLWLGAEVFREGEILSGNQQFYIDSFNVCLIVLTAFVGLTTSVFSRPYMEYEQNKRSLTGDRMRLYFVSFQIFLFTMLLALSTNNAGILWVALEAATLATVFLVSLYRTPRSIEAAWKYFILCGVGIAQALFGTILLYFASSQVIQNPEEAILLNVLSQHATELNPAIMNIAFVFLLVGYGTKVGLVPLHNWLPDAHSEGPTPISAVLSGLLLNVALYALVRMKTITVISVSGGTSDGTLYMPHYLMMGFGLVSFLVAAFFIHRQGDIKRLFSYSSIEHMGLMTFAFGLGTPLATFGAMLHMTVHSLTKSAIFMTVGHACQIAGTQSILKIRGLIQTQPTVGWGLLIGTVAIAGFPPFGIFTSEFLLLVSTMQKVPVLTLLLLSGLVIAFAGLFRHVQPMVFGEVPEGQVPVSVQNWPVILHLALVLLLGLSVPTFISQWFDQATFLISGGHVL